MNLPIDQVTADFPGLILDEQTSAKPRAHPTQEKQIALDNHRVLELAHDAILVRNIFGEIIFWNREAERLYGWSGREALGKLSHELLQTRFAEGFDAMVDKLFEQNTWEGVLTQICRDGTQIMVESRQAVQRNHTGRPVAIIEINRDITQHARTEEKLRQMTAHLLQVQDEERRCIARDLHDSTTQTLAAVAINLANVQARLNGNSELAKILSDTMALAQQAGDEIRNLARLLHPPVLETVGLVAAVRWYANAFAKCYDIRVTVEAHEECRECPEDVKLALFRMVQESLTNVRRHSGSKTASVRVKKEAGHITLEIQDYGKGMPLGNAGPALPGIGISGMHERIRQLGGSLQLDSSPEGTTVRARLPVSSRAAAPKWP